MLRYVRVPGHIERIICGTPVPICGVANHLIQPIRLAAVFIDILAEAGDHFHAPFDAFGSDFGGHGRKKFVCQRLDHGRDCGADLFSNFCLELIFLSDIPETQKQNVG